MIRNGDRLPRGIVRELLGIARVLYCEESTVGDPVRVEQLANIIRMLREALDLSKRPFDTPEYGAAWGCAQRAASGLCPFVRSSRARFWSALRTNSERLSMGPSQNRITRSARFYGADSVHLRTDEPSHSSGIALNLPCEVTPAGRRPAKRMSS